MKPVALVRTETEALDAIALDAADNVATVLRAVASGESLRIGCGDAVFEISAKDAIPLCHKIALDRIAPGNRIVKYGTAIGSATAPIAAGEHVHVHNLLSDRGRREGH